MRKYVPTYRSFFAISAAASLPILMGLVLLAAVADITPRPQEPGMANLTELEMKIFAGLIISLPLIIAPVWWGIRMTARLRERQERLEKTRFFDMFTMGFEEAFLIQFILTAVFCVIWFILDPRLLSVFMLILFYPVSLPFVFVILTLPITLWMILVYSAVGLRQGGARERAVA